MTIRWTADIRATGKGKRKNRKWKYIEYNKYKWFELV